MKIKILLILLFSLIYTTTLIADGLFKTCKSKKECWRTLVKGKAGKACVKTPQGCCVKNKEYDSGAPLISKIGLGRDLLVSSGALVICGVGDFYGTANGVTLKVKKTGVQYQYDKNSKKFIESSVKK